MNPLKLNLDRVRDNVAKAETPDLIDRATAFRDQFEFEALDLIDAELYRRGVTASQLAERREWVEANCLRRPDGYVARCSFCFSPAVREQWGWHRLWGKVPILPRWLRYCEAHAPS